MKTSGKISFNQNHQLGLVAGHHVAPDRRLDLVHGDHVGALFTLHLLGHGEERVEHVGHIGDGDHVGVGHHRVRGGTGVLGGVSGQVLWISAVIQQQLGSVPGRDLIVVYYIAEFLQSL